MRRFPGNVVRGAVQLLGPASERARDSADRPVGAEREGAALPPLKQLGQGVLQQRKAAGLIRGLQQHLREQPRLEVDP